MIYAALIAGLATVWSAGARGADDDILFAATLTPDGETSVVSSPGKGMALLCLERQSLRVRWKATYQDLSSPVTKAGLFGPESIGFNASMQVDFGTRGLGSPLQGEAVLTDGQFQYLISTRMYVNILTAKYKDGEIRGHLRRTPTGAGDADSDFCPRKAS